MLVVFMLVSTASLTACKNKNNKGDGTTDANVEWREADYSLPKKQSFDSDYNAFPRPENQTKQTIYYADITACPYPEMFLSVTLQGIVNADSPELYLIHDYVVQAASATFNSPPQV